MNDWQSCAPKRASGGDNSKPVLSAPPVFFFKTLKEMTIFVFDAFQSTI